MGKNLDTFADNLRDEVVSEMAETFFGARRELEKSIDAWTGVAEKLKTRLTTLSEKASCLGFLLFDEAGEEGFYRLLGADPEMFADLAGRAQAACIAKMRVPFGFTRIGRYIKLVERTYEAFREELDEYLHGSWSDDPKRPGRKVLSPNLSLLKNLAAEINEQVDKVNAWQNPSCALRVIRNLDPEEVEKRRISGATLQDENCGLDRSMAFSHVDPGAEGFPDLPYLPAWDQLRGRLDRYVRRLCDTHADDVAGLFMAIRAARRNLS